MAISIVKKPKNTVWSKNPVVFKLSTDNRYIQEGQQFRAELDFDSGAVDGYTIQFSWNGNEPVFTFKDEPNDSGLELPAKKEGQTLNEWKELLANSLNSYFQLNDDFIITFNVDKINIISRYKKASMNLQLIAASGGLNVSLFVWDYGTDQILRENFALYANLLIQDLEGEFQSFSKSIIEVDEQNQAIWDIQEYLTAALLQQGDPRPTFDSDTIFKEKISARKFYLSFGEMFGYPQQMKQLKSSDHFTALFGGVDLEHEDIYSLPEFLKDGVINKWINNVHSKRILADQKDYACIVNLGEVISSAALWITLYYSDNQIIHKTYLIGIWQNNEKLHIPIGLKPLSSLLGEDIGFPSSFSISIKSGNSLISNSINYTVEHKFLPYSRIFMFMNSLGCFESLFSYGKTESSYTVEKNEKALEQNVERTVIDSSLKEIDINIRDEIKINSGYLSKNEVSKFRDFVLSKSKYIFQDGIFKPIVIDSSSISEYQDGNHLHAISFTVKFSNEQVLYSK